MVSPRQTGEWWPNRGRQCEEKTKERGQQSSRSLASRMGREGQIFQVRFKSELAAVVRVNLDRSFLVAISDSPHDMCRPAISGRVGG